jgi:peroxiredoxin
MKIKTGGQFPSISLRSIHDKQVSIPDSGAKFVHFQFLRFASCPVCNLHLQSFVKRDREVKAAGIREVVVFHSPKESLLEYQSGFPFDVVGDPEKNLFKQFGVENSLWAIFSPKGLLYTMKANLQKNKPKIRPEGGVLGLPAEFLISSIGKVVASHYGTHSADRWSVDDVLALARN